MNEPVVRADPALRRRALILALVIAVAGGAWVAGTASRLEADHSTEALQQWLLATIGVAVAVALAGGIPLLLLARQILKTGQFPPPGRRVLRDTPLRRGPAAMRMAWAAIVVTALLWTCSGVLSMLALRILRSLPI